MAVEAATGRRLWDVSGMTSGVIHLLLAFALIVVVPLAIAVALPARRGTSFALVGALASASFLIGSGTLAAGVAAIWTLVPAALLWRAIRSSDRRVVWLLPFAYMLVGSGWFVLSRYGANPLGFGDRIVELTAIHFHYAGFVTPVLVGRLAGWLAADTTPAEVARRALFGTLAATPLTAAGITVWPGFAALGAALFATALTTTSILTLRATTRREHHGRPFLWISSVSVLVPMVLAVVYALRQWFGIPGPDVTTMVWTHGLLNAVGFSFTGALAWYVDDRASGTASGAPARDVATA